MTAFLFIRHGETDAVGKFLAGRLPGIGLNPQGLAQAERLAERLATLPIEQILSSPLQRTRQTAIPLAERLGLQLQIREGLNEVDCGAWQGLSFEDLKPDPAWRQYHRFRSGTSIPGGESMLSVQARMVMVIEQLRERFPKALLALVSHGDPIRAAIAYYLGIPLDLMLRFEISPASVSCLAVEPWGPRLFCLNHTGDLETASIFPL